MFRRCGAAALRSVGGRESHWWAVRQRMPEDGHHRGSEQDSHHATLLLKDEQRPKRREDTAATGFSTGRDQESTLLWYRGTCHLASLYMPPCERWQWALWGNSGPSGGLSCLSSFRPSCLACLPERERERDEEERRSGIVALVCQRPLI